MGSSMNRRGFTLIEVTMALVVAALVTLIARQVFQAGVETTRSLAHIRRSLDQDSNVRRFLTAAFLSVDVAATDRMRFDGEPDRLHFATWLETPDGWFEPVTMEIQRTGTDLTVQTDTGRPVVLASRLAAARFDFLMDPGADEAWITRWASSLRVPVGVRLRIYQRAPDGRIVGDTMLFQIKERR